MVGYQWDEVDAGSDGSGVEDGALAERSSKGGRLKELAYVPVVVLQGVREDVKVGDVSGRGMMTHLGHLRFIFLFRTDLILSVIISRTRDWRKESQ